jgi:hypothetical protein
MADGFGASLSPSPLQIGIQKRVMMTSPSNRKSLLAGGSSTNDFGSMTPDPVTEVPSSDQMNKLASDHTVTKEELEKQESAEVEPTSIFATIREALNLARSGDQGVDDLEEVLAGMKLPSTFPPDEGINSGDSLQQIHQEEAEMKPGHASMENEAEGEILAEKRSPRFTTIVRVIFDQTPVDTTFTKKEADHGISITVVEVGATETESPEKEKQGDLAAESFPKIHVEIHAIPEEAPRTPAPRTLSAPQLLEQIDDSASDTATPEKTAYAESTFADTIGNQCPDRTHEQDNEAEQPPQESVNDDGQATSSHQHEQSIPPFGPLAEFNASHWDSVRFPFEPMHTVDIQDGHRTAAHTRPELRFTLPRRGEYDILMPAIEREVRPPVSPTPAPPLQEAAIKSENFLAQTSPWQEMHPPSPTEPPSSVGGGSAFDPTIFGEPIVKQEKRLLPALRYIHKGRPLVVRLPGIHAPLRSQTPLPRPVAVPPAILPQTASELASAQPTPNLPTSCDEKAQADVDVEARPCFGSTSRTPVKDCRHENKTDSECGGETDGQYEEEKDPDDEEEPDSSSATSG